MEEKMLSWKSTIFPTSAQVILIISDQADTVLLWKAIFQEKGFTTVHETYENALKTCRAIDPAIVVIDTHLTHTKRLEFCSTLRVMTSCSILLLVTDYNSSQILDIYSTGVDECLLKPVSPAFLMVKVCSWFLRNRWLGQDASLPQICTKM